MTSDTAKHEALVEAANSTFGDKITEIDKSFGDLVLVADRGVVHDVLVFLRQEKDFDMLLDIAGIDGLNLKDQNERFELEYIIYSVSKNHRVRVRVRVPEGDMDLPTATDVWQSANWAEREAFEMYGFNFVGHPCLKRLLTHHEFVGFPLRKDYPIMQGQWCARTSDLTDEMNE